MRQNYLEAFIGFIVLFIAIACCIYVYNIKGHAGVKQYLLVAKFQNIEGITKGSDVKLSGIKIGTVEKISLDSDDFLIHAFLSIDDTVTIPNDSKALVTSSNFLGNKFIAIDPGASSKFLSNNDQIKYTQSSLNLETLLGQFIYSFSKKKE